MKKQHRLVSATLVFAIAPIIAHADSNLVADSLSTAQAMDGKYISWQEHIIDDPRIGNEPDLSGSDGLEMADLDGDGFEDIVSVHEADIVYDGRPVGFVRIAWGTDDPNKWELNTLSSGPEAAAADDKAIGPAEQGTRALFVRRIPVAAMTIDTGEADLVVADGVHRLDTLVAGHARGRMLAEERLLLLYRDRRPVRGDPHQQKTQGHEGQQTHRE